MDTLTCVRVDGLWSYIHSHKNHVALTCQIGLFSISLVFFVSRDRLKSSSKVQNQLDLKQLSVEFFEETASTCNGNYQENKKLLFIVSTGMYQNIFLEHKYSFTTSNIYQYTTNYLLLGFLFGPGFGVFNYCLRSICDFFFIQY